MFYIDHELEAIPAEEEEDIEDEEIEDEEIEEEEEEGEEDDGYPRTRCYASYWGSIILGSIKDGCRIKKCNK